jgi:hypothetical protein
MRLWKLGSLEHKIYPTKQAAERLAEILKDPPEDIIWGPDISVEQIGDEPGEIIVHEMSEELAKTFLELKGYTVLTPGETHANS